MIDRYPSVLIMAVCAGLLLAACSSEPETFNLRGSMTITKNATGYPPPGCHGYNGFDDIDEGAAVTVYDSAGKIVAAGRLQQGVKTGFGGCEFRFEVGPVPDGSDFYQVEVASRGRVTTSAADAKAGNVRLTLG